MTRCIRFTDFELDLDGHELRRRGTPVEVEPKAFELLVLLASSPDHAFTKDEIAGALWSDRVISDTVIAQCVRKARQATDDSAERQAVIRTIHRVGYRFAAEIEASPANPLEQAESSASPEPVADQGLKPAAWFLSALLLAGLLAWLFVPEAQDRTQRRITIAALPFLEGEPMDRELSAGLESLLARELARHSRVDLVPARRVQPLLDRLGLSAEQDPDVLLRELQLALGADFLMRARVDESPEGRALLAEFFGRNGQRFEVQSGQGELAAVTDRFSRSLSDQVRGDWTELDGPPLLSSDDFVNQAFVRALDALLAGESRSAALLFESVVDLAPELIHARYELANARWQLGQHEQAKALYQSVLDQLEGVSSDRVAGHAATMLGVLAWQSGSLDEAEDRYRQALDIYEASGDFHAAASALGNLGNLADQRGDLDQASALAQRARQRFSQARDQVGESAALTNLAVIARLRGRVHESARLQQEAIDIQRRLGIGSMLVRSLTYGAEIDIELGRFESARQALDEARGMAQAQDNRVGQAELALAEARLALEEWQLDAARSNARSAQEIFIELATPAGQILALTLEARSLLALGRFESALALLDQADALDLEISKPRDRLERALIRTRILLETGQEDAALASIDALAGSADATIQAEIAGLRARLAWQTGQPSQALELWQGALAQLDQIDEPGRRTRLMLDKASALIASGQLDRAEDLLARASGWNARAPSVRAVEIQLLLNSGQSERARALLEELRALDPSADPDEKPAALRELVRLLAQVE